MGVSARPLVHVIPSCPPPLFPFPLSPRPSSQSDSPSLSSVIFKAIDRQTGMRDRKNKRGEG